MVRRFALAVVMGVLVLSSCAKKEGTATTAVGTESPKPAIETPAAVEPAPGPHAVVLLKSGDKVPGVIVASSATEMVIAGDDDIERKVPLSQIRSVDYSDPKATSPVAPSRSLSSAPREQIPLAPAPRRSQAPPSQTADDRPLTPVRPPPATVTTRTYELPAGSQISIRTNETIDSSKATEGQTFDAEVTRAAMDESGDVVIPRGSRAQIVILSASRGRRITGASDLTLDLQSVTLNGRPYALQTTNLTRKGQSGVGANKRTATYTGGGAALGAIIGAIAGGGKGAAIGAGAGAGAGALTQIFTRGKAIKVPVETVLTFSLDQSLRVSARE